MELYDPSRSEEISINEMMVLDGYAMKCEEPYLSKVALFSSIFTHFHVTLTLPLFVYV